MGFNLFKNGNKSNKVRKVPTYQTLTLLILFSFLFWFVHEVFQCFLIIPFVPTGIAFEIPRKRVLCSANWFDIIGPSEQVNSVLDPEFNERLMASFF